MLMTEKRSILGTLATVLTVLLWPAAAQGAHIAFAGLNHANACNVDDWCFFVANQNGGNSAVGIQGHHYAITGTAPGVKGTTDSQSEGASAVLGRTQNVNGATYAVFGDNTSTNGYAAGVRARAAGNGYGVHADTGPGGWAVYGTTASNGYGVYGNINGAGSYTAGVYGRNTSTQFGGFGVFGNHEGAGIGVYGEALNGFAVSGYSPNNWSGYFQGSVRVVGNLQKSSGSFTIDHPLDPAGKYLSHSFVESPDMMNVYNGNVVTDRRGFATVRLPRYFQALNRSFRYQLTSLSGLQLVAVASKIRNNRFTIQSERPFSEVSWQVTGIRKDAWANAHRIKVEEAKTGSEAGKYMNPELFGKPASQSVVMLPGMKKGEAARTARKQQ